MTSFWDNVLAAGLWWTASNNKRVLEGEVIQGVFPALMYFQSGPKIW